MPPFHNEDILKSLKYVYKNETKFDNFNFKRKIVKYYSIMHTQKNLSKQPSPKEVYHNKLTHYITIKTTLPPPSLL